MPRLRFLLAAPLLLASPHSPAPLAARAPLAPLAPPAASAVVEASYRGAEQARWYGVDQVLRGWHPTAAGADLAAV